jgi:hypothetical protein
VVISVLAAFVILASDQFAEPAPLNQVLVCDGAVSSSWICSLLHGLTVWLQILPALLLLFGRTNHSSFQDSCCMVVVLGTEQ